MKPKDKMLIDPDILAWESGQGDIPENPPDRKAKPNETREAAEVAVFLQYDLKIDVTRLFIQVRDGFLYVQGSVETLEQKNEILELLPTRAQYKGCEIHLSIQKSE